ncbi:MAG TPA: DUF5946 family protein [Niastella sp.]
MNAGESYNALSYYTLTHPGSSFIHQHIVDAYTAQTADASTKPIGLVFALAGLYLYIEKNFTGKQVQQAHLQMAKNKRPWPAISLPAKRGDITVLDVMAAAPGPERDARIQDWAACVWKAYDNDREVIIGIVEESLDSYNL